MRCFNCCREIPDDSNFCEFCGKALMDNIALYQNLILKGDEIHAVQHYCQTYNINWEEGSAIIENIKRNMSLFENTIY